MTIVFETQKDRDLHFDWNYELKLQNIFRYLRAVIYPQLPKQIAQASINN